MKRGLAVLGGLGVLAPWAAAQCAHGWDPRFSTGADGFVRAMVEFDDGTGPALYVAGDFTSINSVSANHIARWDGNNCSALSSGLNSSVYCLAVFDDGSGKALYAGGRFTTAGGQNANRIAKWDGQAWSPLGGGLTGALPYPDVLALAVYDDGAGPALYATGAFDTADGAPVNYIARWNGAAWSTLGGGLNYASGRALAVYHGALYAGGDFNYAGGISTGHIAKWDGTWHNPIAGVNHEVDALQTITLGGVDYLIAAGHFTLQLTNTANGVCKYDGVSWTPMGTGMTSAATMFVDALAAYDDGSGLALFAAGQFETAGGVAVRNLARWDGTSWSPADPAAPYAESRVNGPVYGLGIFDGNGTLPGGNELFVGGFFNNVGSPAIRSYSIAAWTTQPLILSGPASLAADRGTTAQFNVNVSAAGGISYQWRRNGIALADGRRVSGVTTPTLTVSNLIDTDAGTYDVLVTDNCGVADSNPATLAVYCPGDLNGDALVDISDLAVVLANYGIGQTRAAGDVDGDGNVDLSDIALVCQAYGTLCN